MILTQRQQELAQWYYVDKRTISEIADLVHSSYCQISTELTILRAVFASHGKELPKYNRGRPRLTPNLPDTAVI
jgi:predicted DNA-binding protein YlxM (UPF0122 family)